MNINETKKNTVLVTGATGFIGLHLTKRLVEDAWDVHVITRSSSNQRLLKNVSDKIKIYEHDGTIDNMIEIVKSSNPSIVMHLASLGIAEHKPNEIHDLIYSNIEFGVQLMEAMVLNGVDKLINTGTYWQHYNHEVYNPVCLYAATKQAFEDLIKYYIETSTLKVITLKLFDTYGPFDNRKKLFSLLRNASINHTPLQMSPGEQYLDLVYIDDVVDAYLISIQRIFKGKKISSHEHFFVSSGEKIQLKALVELYMNIIKKNINIIWGGRPYRKREVMEPFIKGNRLPGWKSKIGFKEGIEKMEELNKQK